MSGTEKYPVLDYIVKTLKNAIADAKLESISPTEHKIKDGNDEIILKQEGTEKDGGLVIMITDKRRIIFSEDLLETLQFIYNTVKGNDELKSALKNTTIIINDLNIETELVFQAIKDVLDQVSNSYEFITAVEQKVTQLKAGFKFGKHLFGLTIVNDTEKITIEPIFGSSFDASIQKTVSADIKKVEVEVNDMFKE